MAKANYVKAARKDYPVEGISKGEPYWWWEIPFQPVRRSKTQPKASQLTSSDFLQQVYGLQEDLEALTATATKEDITSAIEDTVSQLNALAEEQESRRENIPEQLQDSGSGQLLQDRADKCREWADSLENIDTDVALEDLLEEVTSYSTYDGE